MLMDSTIVDIWICSFLVVVFLLGLLCGRLTVRKDDCTTNGSDSCPEVASYYCLPSRRNKHHMFLDCPPLRGKQSEVEAVTLRLCDTCIKRKKKLHRA